MRMIIFLMAGVLAAGCAGPVQRPLIVAHRGASFDAPENTIPAFLLAWEQGADAIEGDFFLTSDGEIVCIHDHRTGRVAGADLVVSESTLEELRSLDVGEWKGEQFRGSIIPTLSEVFSLVPAGKKIFVEIKPGIEILPKLYEEIDNSGLAKEQIVIISFSAEVVEEFKKQRPDHKAYWLSGFREDGQGNIIPGVDDVLQTMARTGADGFSSNFRLIDGEYIRTIIDAGYEYHVWTVNDPETALRFTEYGAVSVTTDKPGLIRKYLESLGTVK